MAGELLIEIGNPTRMGLSGERNEVIIDWAADSSGNASGEVAALYSAKKVEPWETKPTALHGTLYQVNTSPGYQGTQALALPSGEYDMYLLDNRSMDVAQGFLENRSRHSGEFLQMDPPIRVDSELTFKVENAGVGGKGRTVLIFVD